MRRATLPDDVALKIAANEVLELNFHMFNTGDQPIHACYKQNLYGIPDAQVKQEAGPQVIGGGAPETSAARYASQSCFTGTCANVLAHGA